MDFYPLWDDQGHWITDAENKKNGEETVNPLDLDEEFNFVEWKMELSMRDHGEVIEDDLLSEVRSTLL